MTKSTKKSKRGGRRNGSGRHKKEPTMVIRVPKSKLEVIRKIINEDHPHMGNAQQEHI